MRNKVTTWTEREASWWRSGRYYIEISCEADPTSGFLIGPYHEHTTLLRDASRLRREFNDVKEAAIENHCPHYVD